MQIHPSLLPSSLLSSSLAASLLLAGCAAPGAENDPSGGGSGLGKADQISGADDPSGLLQNAERRLSTLVTAADVGQTFGVDDDKIPYPDTYWPMVDNGVAAKWLEKSGQKCSSLNQCNDPQPSPLEKFVALTDPERVEDAVAWEIENHGEDVPDVASWFGHCPGWVATAMLNPPVTGPVWIKRGAFGLEKCEPEESGCTKFEIGDVNAIGAEAHEGAVSRFIGARCDTEPSEIERDEFGRIVRNGSGCKGLNAGAMLIVVGNRLKMEQKPFAIDAQNEFTTDQIWNQPAYRYTVNRFEQLTESEATNLVATGGASRTGDLVDYQWNDNAGGFAFIDFTLHWVSETSGPNLTVVSGAQTTRTTRMVAVIELDRDPSDPSAEIIGGEYLDDAGVGANRLKVAPFAWIAVDAGPAFRHNPFVERADAKKLIELALEGDDGGGEGGETCEHSTCTEGAALSASCGSCAADVCAQDSFCCNSAWDDICVGEAETICGLDCSL